MAVKKNRIFDGKRYKLHRSFESKLKAKAIARRWRKEGYKVRLVESYGKYRLYKRRT